MAGARAPRKKKVAPSPGDASAAARELRGHQIELQMQNEELRRAHVELDAQREKYFELFDRAPVGYLALDDSGVVRDANLTAARLLGVERQQLVHEPLSAFVFAADQDVYYRHLGLIRSSGWPQTCDLRLHSVDAEPFWVSLEWRTQSAAPGEPLRYQVTFADVHERVLAEEALRESEEKHRVLLDESPDPMFSFTPEGRYKYVNRAFADGVGKTVEGIIGRTIWDVFPKEEADQRFAALSQVFSTGAQKVIEARVPRADGDRCYVTTITPIKDTSGEVSSVICSSKDITARKRAEEELRASEQNFSAFFDAVEDLIGVATPDGRLIYPNPALSAKLGYSAAELTGMKVLDLYPAERRAEAEAVFAALARGEGDVCSLPLQGKTGALVPVETRVWPGKWNGADCIFGVSKDLSAEQETLQKFERLFRGNPVLMALSTLAEQKFVDVNDACLGALGYTREEVLGRTSEDLDIFVEPEQQRAAAELLLAQGRIADFELRVRRKDGTFIDGLVSAEIIGSPGRQYLLTAMVDQAELKQARGALTESERRTRGILESMTEGVVLFAEDGQIVSANPAAESMLGLTRSAREDLAYDDPHWELQCPDGSPLPLEETPGVRATREKRVVKDVVTGFTQAGGAVSWFNVSAAPLLDATGEVEGIVTSFSDISERKRAEDALQESEERYRTLFERTANPTFVIDIAGNYISGNDAALQFLECTHEELLTMNVVDHVPPGRDRVIDDHIPLWETGGTIETAYFVNRRIKTLELTITPGSWQGKQVVFGIGVDVTERQQAEAELQDSEQNFSAFFDAVDDIIVVATPEGRLMYANPALSAKLGYGADEVTSLHVLDLNPADRRPEAEAIFAAMLRGERESCLLPLQTKSGALVPVETRVWLGRWDGADCVFGVSKDLSSEQEALQKFERLFRGNPAPMALSSVPDGRFIDVNEAFLSTLGYSREEVLGRATDELDLFVEREKQQEMAAQLQAQGRVTDRLLKVKCKDGTILDGLFSGEIIESQGRELVLTVMVDQTERKWAQEELRESEERHRTILRTTLDGFWLTDSVGRLLEVNEAYCRMSGYSEPELLAMRASDLEVGRTASEIAARMQRIVAEGEDRFQSQHRRKDGGLFDVEISVRYQAAEGGRFAGFLRDITGSKQVEQHLAAAARQWRQTFDAMSDSVALFDEESRALRCNAVTVTLTGRPFDEIVGHRCFEVFHGTAAFHADCPQRRALRSGRTETSTIEQDGHWLRFTFQPLTDEGGRVSGGVHVVTDVTELKQAEQGLLESLTAQEAITEGVITALSRSIEVRDPYTAGHQRRVSELAAAMALHMGLGEACAEGLRVGGILHDVGKITIPAEILSRPGLLSTMEYELIKGHAQAGYEILAAIDFPWPVAEMALQHHEREDGSGYPAGLAGEGILPEARILAVADVVEAMASHRPYRPALGLEAALAEVRAGAGTRFEAAAVAACEQVLAEGFVFSEA